MKKIGMLLVLCSLSLLNVGCEDKTKPPAPVAPTTKPDDKMSGDKMAPTMPPPAPPTTPTPPAPPTPPASK